MPWRLLQHLVEYHDLNPKSTYGTRWMQNHLEHEHEGRHWARFNNTAHHEEHRIMQRHYDLRLRPIPGKLVVKQAAEPEPPLIDQVVYFLEEAMGIPVAPWQRSLLEAVINNTEEDK